VSRLKCLAENYDETSNRDENLRVKLILEMIEYNITYPPPIRIETHELQAVNERVHHMTRELERKGQKLLAKRIHKIWEKRDHLLQIAENAHHLDHDFMDTLEYHEEIRWVRNQIDAFRQKSERSLRDC
jgi:hypothetical protein